MKKMMFFGLMLALYFHAAAQVKFGITGGAILAKTSADGSSNQLGAYLGAVMDLKIGKSGSFRPQLKYVMKGEKNAGNDVGHYNYLELPMNFVYNIPSSIGRFSVGGGPVLGYMTNGSWTVKGGTKEEIYFKYDNVNQLDYGLNLMAGCEIKGGVFFTVNYTLGLNNVWSAANIGTNKNRALGFGIGIMF